jgi:hypothetical protein
MEFRDFEAIESELLRVLRSNDQTRLKHLLEEVKRLPEETINQMPEVVYARYLRLLAKAEKYGTE